MSGKKNALNLLNSLISRKGSTLNAYKKVKTKLSKKEFSKLSDDQLKSATISQDLKGGNKALKDLKKQRKDIASGRTRFIRINGRVVPIRD